MKSAENSTRRSSPVISNGLFSIVHVVAVVEDARLHAAAGRSARSPASRTPRRRPSPGPRGRGRSESRAGTPRSPARRSSPCARPPPGCPTSSVPCTSSSASRRRRRRTASITRRSTWTLDLQRRDVGLADLDVHARERLHPERVQQGVAVGEREPEVVLGELQQDRVVHDAAVGRAQQHVLALFTSHRERSRGVSSWVNARRRGR